MAPSADETLLLFQHDRVADGYASARPYLHPEVFARLRLVPGWPETRARALDVGCGTGMSSVALRDVAGMVVGCDASLEMIRRARPAANLRYVVSRAETLPFADRTFDLVLACGSMDWIDRPRFVPDAARVLSPGGWLVSLDFGDTGRSDDMPGLESWYHSSFLAACPCPAAADPYLTATEAESVGLSAPHDETFTLQHRMSMEEYADFLMTESAVVSVVEYGGRPANDVRAWLRSELEPLFGGQSRRIIFGGYLQALQLRQRD